jgi:hypothetical protein
MSQDVGSNLEDLLKRANYKCEYCHIRLQERQWQKEHIISRSRGGPDTASNLAVSCPKCNLNKGDRILAEDPVSSLTVPLFNPRRGLWGEHFRYTFDGHIVGTTAIGRATAALLFRLTNQSLPKDLKWQAIQEIRDEALYDYLNHQRAIRLANKFSALENEVNKKNFEIIRRASAEDRRRGNFAFKLLELETYMMRSQVKDIQKGIRYAHRLLKSPLLLWDKSEVLHILSILQQQYATIFALEGNIKKALALQKEASRCYELSLASTATKTFEHIRYVTLRAKYDGRQDKFYVSQDLDLAIEEAKEGKLKSITYIADAELRRRGRYFDKVLEAIDETLQACGYGQDFDYVRSIVLRRRWWALKLNAGETCDLDLLAKDVKFWRSIDLSNEIRELRLLLSRSLQKSKHTKATEMLHVINSAS